MISFGGYTIVYEKNMNRITIQLPQTMETLTSTLSMPVKRKTNFTDTELFMILNAVKGIAERESRGAERTVFGE